MGGHQAWRKRVAEGELMKGAGGAAMRHHPRLGRRGKDLALNRKGNIGGRPNPKRKDKRKRDDALENIDISISTINRTNYIGILILIAVVVASTAVFQRV